MTRDIERLTKKEYDILIVGAGIYGAALAREASLRGLSVAIVDKGDFCGATSANSLKIIHGGIRYLQQGDLPRLRQSMAERRMLM
ncbi:MAG: glycerol-3-phosphate dehydrogenase/oxidase, partial [Verrucomicrobia bacterium]|nr:glycerol-3-phosphate dehydrogenase/oxidase [Verrucomicrobiota bacterium]